MQLQRSVFPLAIALFGIVAIAAAGAYRVSQLAGGLQAAIALIVVLYILWIVSEFRVTAGETKKKDVRDDKGTCEAYAIARLVMMLSGLALPAVWTALGWWYALGALLFGGGIALRWYAIRTLGRAYSHRVRTPDQHLIVTSGPYRYLRHPAYAGMLLAHVGILILFFNWFLLAIFALLFVPVVIRRITVEEAHLLRIPSYQAYASGRRRVVPGLW